MTALSRWFFDSLGCVDLFTLFIGCNVGSSVESLELLDDPRRLLWSKNMNGFSNPQHNPRIQFTYLSSLHLYKHIQLTPSFLKTQKPTLFELALAGSHNSGQLKAFSNR